MSALPPVIVLGIDTPIGLSVVRELGMRGVPVYGIGRCENAIGAASRYCLAASVRPANGALEQWLPQLIAKVGAKALLAISEDDLIALAAMPDVIEGCQILTPRAGPLRIVLDKRETLARAAALGIDIPETWQPAEADDFPARAAALAYPIVAKWPDPPRVVAALAAVGLPLHKAEFIGDAAALLALLERTRGLKLWPLIQQYCPGSGLGQMLFIDQGLATLRFQHKRLHEWPAEGGVSTLCRVEASALHATQMAKSEALLKAIGWQGPAMVEYRYDPVNGRYALMEINGRFWGSMPLATHAGAHFAWEAYRRAVLGETSEAPPHCEGLRARYMIPETRRLLRLLFGRGRIADPFFTAHPVKDLIAYLAGFLDPNMRYFVFSLSDPGPFLADAKAVLFKALRRGRP
jgi:predicted ATP-grasp superfamily ATP-dependent carboligase